MSLRVFKKFWFACFSQKDCECERAVLSYSVDTVIQVSLFKDCIVCLFRFYSDLLPFFSLKFFLR